MRYWDSSIGEGGHLDVFLYHMEKDISQCSNSPVHAACLTHMKDDLTRLEEGLGRRYYSSLTLLRPGRVDRTTAPGRTRTTVPHHCENTSSWRIPCPIHRYQAIEFGPEMSTMLISCYFFTLSEMHSSKEQCQLRAAKVQY